MKKELLSRASAQKVIDAGKVIKAEQYLIPLLISIIDTSSQAVGAATFAMLAGELYHLAKKNTESIKAAWIPFWFNTIVFEYIREIVDSDLESMLWFFILIMVINYGPHAVVKALSD